LPWRDFNSNKSPLYLSDIKDININEIILAKSIYGSRWEYVTRPVHLLHIRNLYQIFGWKIKSIDEEASFDPHYAESLKSKFVVCWTDRSEDDVGGTQFGLHVAKKYNILTYNFYYKQEEEKFYSFLNTLIKGETNKQ
jgi:hypothetical protein